MRAGGGVNSLRGAMNPNQSCVHFVGAFLVAGLLFVSGCGEKKQPAAGTKAEPSKSEVQKPVEPESKAAPVAAPKPETVSTLAAYYHFDEARGAGAVADKTGRREGRPNAGVQLGADGQVRGAADFSASRGGQIMVADPLNLAANRVTIAAWVKRRGPQQPGAALVFCRGGEIVSGMQVGGGNELEYVWNRTGRSSWKSGLVLPDGAWTFVALVVEPDKAALFMGIPGQQLKSAVNEIPHDIAEFSGALTFGRDPIAGIGFEGAIDEVGVWKNAMSAGEIEKLFVVGQKLGAAAAAPQTERPAASGPAAGSGSEYDRAVALFNNAVDAYRNFMQTRKNPAVLGQIEDNMRHCITVFERAKARPQAGTDPQGMIDRCNKMIFDCHAAKQVAP